jgi:hypothetical protein
MPRKTLGEFAKQEIREAMRGLTGTPAKQEAVRLATNHGVRWSYIYRMTEDLRATTRKPRSDKGKRSFELVEGSDLWYAAQFVIVDKLDPSEALLTARVRRPDAKLPTLEYFRSILAENDLGKRSLRTSRRAYRRWEAEYPGQIYQVDCTALKVRWQDEKTRRILRIEGIDKNHPQMDGSKLRVWQIMLVDDCSRRRFLRYIATSHITSQDMVRFECEAFNKLGIPQTLYSDNGPEFKGYHTRAEKILNTVLKDDGGYRHLTHKPNNPQASGKVENAHKWAEKMDRLVGLAVTEGQIVTAERLNEFADRVCDHYNNIPHRVTGETPMSRWSSRRVVVRTIDPDVIESALLSDEFIVKMDAALTIAHKGVFYKVPSVDTEGKATPFVNYTDKKVKVVVPPSIPIILLTLPNAKGKFEPDHGGEFEIEKIIATADAAGEFRSTADSNAENLKKRLKDTRKQEIAAIKQQTKLTGEIAPVPHLNVVIEQPATNVTAFPHPERVFTAEEVAAVTPIATTLYTGREIGYWEAVGMFADRFSDVVEAKAFLEASLFPNTEGRYPESEVEQAINDRERPAFKSGLRLAG